MEDRRKKVCGTFEERSKSGSVGMDTNPLILSPPSAGNVLSLFVSCGWGWPHGSSGKARQTLFLHSTTGIAYPLRRVGKYVVVTTPLKWRARVVEVAHGNVMATEKLLFCVWSDQCSYSEQISGQSAWGVAGFRTEKSETLLSVAKQNDRKRPLTRNKTPSLFFTDRGVPCRTRCTSVNLSQQISRKNPATTVWSYL